MIDVGVSNPFATKFVNAGRLAFVGLEEAVLDRLARKLVQQNGNGQIVGRHGVGKTTLTYELERRVAIVCDMEMDFKFVRKTIGLRGRVRSANAVKQVLSSGSSYDGEYSSIDPHPTSRSANVVLVLDGFERLSWFQRIALIKSCQRKRIGLLLTSHRRIWGVPTLIELEPDFARFKSVFECLISGGKFQLSSERLREIFANNDGDMREALMSCYDEFEASRARTAC